MKKFVLLWTCLIAVSIGSTATRAAAAPVPTDDAALRQLILQVIKDNPKVIYDAVNSYLRQKRDAEHRQEMERRFKKRVKDIVSKANPQKGPHDAPITIIEYTDFECPYCARASHTMEQLFKVYPGKLRLVFKNNPLTFHKQAVPAARAALAAFKQGQFWPYHDLLFAHHRELDAKRYMAFAKQLGLDLGRFEKDRHSAAVAKQIAAEKARAKAHKFSATPTFIINGVVVVGAQRIDRFTEVIDRLLAEKPKG